MNISSFSGILRSNSSNCISFTEVICRHSQLNLCDIFHSLRLKCCDKALIYLQCEQLQMTDRANYVNLLIIPFIQRKWHLPRYSTESICPSSCGPGQQKYQQQLFSPRWPRFSCNQRRSLCSTGRFWFMNKCSSGVVPSIPAFLSGDIENKWDMMETNNNTTQLQWRAWWHDKETD